MWFSLGKFFCVFIIHMLSCLLFWGFFKKVHFKMVIARREKVMLNNTIYDKTPCVNICELIYTE